MGKHKEKSKKHKKEKKHKDKKKQESRSSSSSSDEWVEKGNRHSSDEDMPSKKQLNQPENKSTRDEWMSLSTSFATESNKDKQKLREENKRIEKELGQYNPRTHTRELNPYWKDGGDGLPKFKKPTDSNDKKYKSTSQYKSSSGWRKKAVESMQAKESSPQETHTETLSDKDLNILASKLVKAEIMGKTELVRELRAKLENAQQNRGASKTDEVILTQTDSRGQTRPVRVQSDYGECSGTQKKKRKIETHQDGQRVRYFADDDKHSLQQMFENEKFNSVQDQNLEFVKMANKVRKNDDLEDIFTDNIRKEESDYSRDKRNRDKAISDHQRVAKSIDNCKSCLQSNTMPKHLMISLGETAFLSLPSFEPLTQGHCLIVPIRHVICSTQLDENEWEGIMNIRRALTRMFQSKNEDVIFFEIAKNFEKYPHMRIECIPVNNEEGDLAPIYFKKAIDECEVEWAQNKKLVSLKGRNVRKAVPKGLPYFFVSFGMEEGYAHVIEDEKAFPQNFAQEIIGGMLDLHHSKWRKPKSQSFEEQSMRVVEFSKDFNEFDDIKT